MNDQELKTQRELYKYGDKRQYGEMVTPFDTLISDIKKEAESKGYTLSRWKSNTGFYQVCIVWSIHTGRRTQRNGLLPDNSCRITLSSREGISEKSLAYEELTKLLHEWRETQCDK